MDQTSREEATMESKSFSGKNQYDVDQQIWNWRSAHPHIKVVKTHPA